MVGGYRCLCCVHASMCPPVNMHVCLSVCLSVCVSVCVCGDLECDHYFDLVFQHVALGLCLFVCAAVSVCRFLCLMSIDR